MHVDLLITHASQLLTIPSHDHGPQRGQRLGDLAIDDFQLAATQFMQMCQASLFMPFIFQAAPAPTPERVARVIGSAVRIFLAGYQKKKG